MIGLRTKVEFSRRVAKGGVTSFHRAMNAGPFASALALAQAAKKRVAQQGRPVQPFKGYAGVTYSRHRGRDHKLANHRIARKRLVSPRYPVDGGRVGPSGVRIFESSQDLHRSTKPGSFNVTGGMWGGLTTIVSGTKVARNKFRGRSEGQGMARHRRGDEPYFDERGRPRPRKVSNANKVAAVLRSTGVNVLLPTRREHEGVGQAAVDMARNGVLQAMVARVDFHTPQASRSALARAIMGNGLVGNLRVSSGGYSLG